MKTFKPYILSLLALISAAPLGAMQVKQKQAQSTQVSGAIVLKELADKLHADVEKVVNFDVRSEKVPGSLRLAQSLRPFVICLTGQLADLKAPLNSYISLAIAFDNAKDTELMEQLSQATEYLSERIAYHRGFAEVKPVAQEQKSILIKDDSQKNKKKTVNFDETVGIKTFIKDKPEQPVAPQAIMPIIEQPVVAQPIKPLLISGERIGLTRRNSELQVAKPRRVRQPLVTAQEKKNAIIATTALATPLIAAGLHAAYNAGYLSPNFDAVKNVVSTVSNAAARYAPQVGGQLVATGTRIARNLGNLGNAGWDTAVNFRNAFIAPAYTAAYGFTAPYHTAMKVSAGVVGAHHLRKVLSRPSQQVQQSAPRSSVVIEELDANGKVIASSNAVKQPKKRNPIITRNRVLTTACLSAPLAVAAAYNYFANAPVQTEISYALAPQITQLATAPATTLAANTLNAVSGFSLPAVSAPAGTDVYRWLVGNAINPWQ